MLVYSRIGRDGGTHAVQRAEVERALVKLGLDVHPDHFEDTGEPGEALAEVRARIERGECDGVAVHNLRRFGSSRETWDMIRLMSARDLRLVAVEEGLYAVGDAVMVAVSHERLAEAV